MGTIRLILALAVLEAHGIGLFSKLSLPILSGREAVQIFYVISGFYMTLILNTKYVSATSNKTFYLNRFLRLWPPYMVVFIVSALIFIGSGRVMLWKLESSMDKFIGMLGSFPLEALLVIMISNLAIFGQDLLFYLHIGPEGIAWAPFESSDRHNGASFSINHPAFSVAIEGWFYLIAPFILRKSLRLLAVITTFGLMYHLFLWHFGHYEIAYSYHFLIPALYFFGMGAIAYHAYRHIAVLRLSHKSLSLHAEFAAYLVSGLIYLLLVKYEILGDSFPRILILAMCAAVSLPFIFSRTKNFKFDRFAGDFSYSIYIIHIPALFIYHGFLGGTITNLYIFVGILVMALAMNLLVERPIDRWRQALARSSQRDGSTAIPASIGMDQKAQDGVFAIQRDRWRSGVE